MIYIKKKDKNFECKARLGFAKCHYRLGQTEKAIDIFESDLKDAEENLLNNIVVLVSSQLIIIYHKIAQSYENEEDENIKDALFYYEKCLDVMKFMLKFI